MRKIIFIIFILLLLANPAMAIVRPMKVAQTVWVAQTDLISVVEKTYNYDFDTIQFQLKNLEIENIRNNSGTDYLPDAISRATSLGLKSTFLFDPKFYTPPYDGSGGICTLDDSPIYKAHMNDDFLWILQTYPDLAGIELEEIGCVGLPEAWSNAWYIELKTMVNTYNPDMELGYNEPTLNPDTWPSKGTNVSYLFSNNNPTGLPIFDYLAPQIGGGALADAQALYADYTAESNLSGVRIRPFVYTIQATTWENSYIWYHGSNPAYQCSWAGYKGPECFDQDNVRQAEYFLSHGWEFVWQALSRDISSYYWTTRYPSGVPQASVYNGSTIGWMFQDAIEHYNRTEEILPLAILSQPENKTSAVDSTVVFSVSAQNATTFQWQRNGTNITGANTTSYSFVAALADNQSLYRVLVSNATSSLWSNNATLTITTPSPPYITYHPVNATVYVGQSGTFSVTSTGIGSLSYIWQKNGSGINGSNVSSYTTPGTSLDDNQSVYSVIVYNEYGNVTSVNVTLTVLPQAPDNLLKNNGFESGTSNWYFYDNGLLSSFSAVTHWPPEGLYQARLNITPSSNIQLYQTDISVINNTQYNLSFWGESNNSKQITIALIQHVSPYTNYGLSHTFNLTPTIQNYNWLFNATATATDGRFQVWLGNSIINSSTILYLDDFILIPYIPSYIQTNTTPQITSVSNGSRNWYSMDVNFTVNQSDARTAVWYSQNSNMSGYSVSSELSSELDRNHTLTGLSSGTKYYYQAVAYNLSDQNLIGYSPTYNFSTLGNITDSFNVTVDVNGVFTYSNGSTLQYIDVPYDNTVNNWINITVHSWNSSGNGTLSTLSYYSEFIEGITNASTPLLSSVTNQTCLAHSCVISFDVNQSTALTQVKYGLNTSLLQNTVNQSSNISRTDNLTGLVNNTLYYYSVFAWNSSNNSFATNSTIQSFTTAEDYTPASGSPAITSYAPTTPTSSQEGVSKAFNISINQTANVTWRINGTSVQTNTSVSNATYTNVSSVVGSWNVTAEVTNANGSTSQIWLWTVTALPTYAPAITSYAPTDLTPTIDVNNLATFNATANQSVTWTWTGVTEGAGDGTTDSIATQTWTTTGAKTVTAICSNFNGSCGTTQWDVTVVSDGSGGGTNYDWLSGTVNVSGATITTNPSVCTTTGGAYSCDYVFIDSNIYWINVSKSGYYANNTQITFNEDHEIWNVTLYPIPPVPTAPRPTAIMDYNFDQHFNDLVSSNLSLENLTSVGSSPYTDLMGTVFWGLIFAIIFIMLWISMEDVTIPALLGMIIGGSIWSLMPPEWVSIGMSLTVISFAGLVYSLLRKG